MKQQRKKNVNVFTKTVSLAIIVFMITSMIPVVLGADEPIIKEHTYFFSQPVFQQSGEQEGYIELIIDGANIIETEYPGAPLLKQAADAFYLPEQAKNIQVHFTYDTKEQGAIPRGQHLSPSPIQFL